MRVGFLDVLSTRRSLSLFLAGIVCLAGWQVWLTWRLMEQDRSLEIERSRQQLDHIADLAIAELARSLGDWDLAVRDVKSLPPMPSTLAKLPKDGTLILVTEGAVETYPRKPVLFVPKSPLLPAATARAFDTAEERELREQQYGRAIEALQPLVDQPATRAEALLRMARNERKAGRKEAALEVYRRLMNEDSLNSNGAPYPHPQSKTSVPET